MFGFFKKKDVFKTTIDPTRGFETKIGDIKFEHCVDPIVPNYITYSVDFSLIEQESNFINDVEDCIETFLSNMCMDIKMQQHNNGKILPFEIDYFFKSNYNNIKMIMSGKNEYVCLSYIRQLFKKHSIDNTISIFVDDHIYFDFNNIYKQNTPDSIGIYYITY